MEALNRCGIAIRLPQAIGTALGEVQVELRRKAGGDLVRWTPVSELALTIVSLGELSPQKIVQVDDTVRPLIARGYPFEVHLEGVGGSPTNLQPRFVWAGLGGDTALIGHMNGALERAVAPLLPGHEVKEFQPQVPLGRLKQESEANRSSLGRALRVASIAAIGSFRVEAIELIRYSATGAGLTVLTVATYPLENKR